MLNWGRMVDISMMEEYMDGGLGRWMGELMLECVCG
jgi:hypothetical protein